MTASAIQGDREKCLDAGMNNYLAKPVRAQTLKTLLESYLNKESEEKEIPNLQVEAKQIVKDALNEADGANGAKKGPTGGVEAGEKMMRSRPPSVRSTTQRWLGPKGADGTTPS